MSTTYPDWSPTSARNTNQRPSTGMGAFLTSRLGSQPRSLRERLPSIAVSAAAHGLLAYVILSAGLSVMEPKEEVQTISVSIATQQLARPEPSPMPRVEQLPDMKAMAPDIAPPILEIAAPPAQMTIQPAPTVSAPSAQAKPVDATPVSPPRFDAAYLNNPVPVYPNMSRRLRETGVVQLRVLVNASGQPL